MEESGSTSGLKLHSAADAAFRSTQIEKIDAGDDFKPATFRSSRNDKNKKQHMKVCFEDLDHTRVNAKYLSYNCNKSEKTAKSTASQMS